jgi:hypothetical protein
VNFPAVRNGNKHPTASIELGISWQGDAHGCLSFAINAALRVFYV